MPISLNAGKWRQLEYNVRRLAAHSEKLLIVTGPVFCPGLERIGASGSPCRASYSRCFSPAANTNCEAYAAVLPNTGNPSEPLRFAASVDTAEQLTGLDFFPNLPTRHATIKLSDKSGKLFQN
jgi:endonuclease G